WDPSSGNRNTDGSRGARVGQPDGEASPISHSDAPGHPSPSYLSSVVSREIMRKTIAHDWPASLRTSTGFPEDLLRTGTRQRSACTAMQSLHETVSPSRWSHCRAATLPCAQAENEVEIARFKAAETALTLRALKG